jgi:putative ABC transport system permease protein
MNVWQLVRKEILHRKLNFALAVVSVMVAVAVLVAEVVVLRAHDARTEAVLEAKQKEADDELARMVDDYRKYMKELGFNLLILPAKQDMTEFLRTGTATQSMPEEYVARLARTGTTLMRHLLPLVQQRVRWTEKEREITLVGTRGEVPIEGRDRREAMLQAVPDGKAVIGYQLAHDLKLKPGTTITLRGRRFEVLTVRPQRGTAEDATVWLSLADAQAMLDMPGRINGIEALKCHCTAQDAEVIGEKVGEEVAALREMIQSALPETQVLVRENRVMLRAKARLRAKRAHKDTILKWETDRRDLRRSREALAAVLVPLVILGSAVWIGLLAAINVRERRGEIGILRAIGVRSQQVFTLFLAKAKLVGAVGALLGCLAGVGFGAAAAYATDGSFSAGALAMPWLFVAVILAAPILSAVAGLVPAMMAARHDPAVVLREE